jgi:hypothetical protein
VLRSGGRWIDAPPEYGPRKTLYNRYVRWAASFGDPFPFLNRPVSYLSEPRHRSEG